MTNEPDASPEELLRALADPDRLAIAGALAKGPRTAQDLAGALGLTAAAARRHAAKLAAVGVVAIDADRRTYHLRPETLRQAALRVGPSRDPGMALGAVYGSSPQSMRSA
ncbi:MAG: ArsR family transcriptional regulator [Actinobacteria bacterium]|nr:MAG: ArsR family transcriptional regulator [Actinomycetota bacterium]